MFILAALLRPAQKYIGYSDPHPRHHMSFEQIIVAWQHQRWVWHTTFYREASHVMFYEDLKVRPPAVKRQLRV